jgi:hypothetical protein
MADQRLAASVLWIAWLALKPSRKVAVRSVFGCKPHYQTTALYAALALSCFKKKSHCSLSLIVIAKDKTDDPVQKKMLMFMLYFNSRRFLFTNE